MNTQATETQIAQLTQFRFQIWGYLDLPGVKGNKNQEAKVYKQLDDNEAEIGRLKASLIEL